MPDKLLIASIYHYPTLQLYWGIGKPRHQQYASKCGADYWCVENLSFFDDREVQNNDNFDRPPNWWKFSLLEAFLDSDYDRMLFLDSDIFIEDFAPNIFAEHPHAKIGMVCDWRIECRENGIIGGNAKQAYPDPESDGFTMPDFIRYYNTGVILINRKGAEDLVALRKKIPVRTPVEHSYVEQTYLNILFGQLDYPIYQMQQAYNVFATPGFDDNVQGYFMHYVGPEGRHHMQQREVHGGQYGFQHKYCREGRKILNVGCETDCGGIKATYGATNLDCNSHSVLNPSQPLPVDVVCDARVMFTDGHVEAEYDTVLMGEMLEHLESEDRVKVFKEARQCWRQQFECDIVVTFPEDFRPTEVQGDGKDKLYDSGDPADHRIAITWEAVRDEAAQAGLQMSVREKIQYGFGDRGKLVAGWGMVFTPMI